MKGFNTPGPGGLEVGLHARLLLQPFTNSGKGVVDSGLGSGGWLGCSGQHGLKGQWPQLGNGNPLA